MNIATESYNNIRKAQNALCDEYGIDDGFDLSDYDPVYNSLEVIKTENKVIVGFLTYDQDPSHYFDDDEGAGEFKEFRNAEDRDSEVLNLSKTKKLFYLVSRHKHGNVHYSVSGTNSYGNDKFDVAHGCGLYIPDPYIQSEYRKMKKTDGEGSAYEHFIKHANSTLDSYSDWCNGEVYTYNVIVFDTKGNQRDIQQCSNFIGNEYAEKEKNSVMKGIVISEEINELMKNVVINQLDLKNIDLPFKLPKKGLKEVHLAHVYDTYVVGAKYEGEDNTFVYKWSDGDKKPIKAQFGEWQKRYGVSSEQFMKVRMESDVKEVLRKNLKDNTDLNKQLSI